MSSNHRSHGPISATQRDPQAQSPKVIDASGMFLADLRGLIVSNVRDNDGALTVTNFHGISDLQQMDSDASSRFLETLDEIIQSWVVEEVHGKPQSGGVTVHQPRVEYDQAGENSRLDANADEHNIAIIRLSKASALQWSHTSTESLRRNASPDVGERWKRMADKQEESHFVREMAKDLAPHFDALRLQSEKLDQRLTEVNAKLTDQGFALSGVARRLDEYYQQTITHNQSLENEIASLRQEMSQSSAKTNALLEKIASSLEGREAQ